MDFLLQKSHQDDVFILKTTVYYYDKIASEGEGCKPSHEQYIAESEFVLLGIFQKQCLIIYFYLGSSGQHGCKQK